MTRAPAVIDTNIVVAGLISSRDTSPVARVLDGMLTSAFPFVLSQPLIAEYRDVLARPKLIKQHGLKTSEVETLLVDIVQRAIILDPVRGPPAPDPKDQHLWDLLALRADLLLITGDLLLFEDVGMRNRILTAQSFLALT